MTEMVRADPSFVACAAAFICHGMDLTEDEECVKEYFRNNKVKVNKHSIHLLSVDVKRRMITLLLCIQRLCVIGKDLKMMILDHCFSTPETVSIVR